MTFGPRILMQGLWLLAIAAAVIIYLRYVEKETIFFPMKEINYLPQEAGLGFEDVFFKSPDGIKINGWFISAQSASGKTIIFCHGNAGNISHRLEKLKVLHALGYSVLIFDYRGYGRSEGRPSEKGIYSDAEGAYSCLLSRGIKPEEIIGYGESIGGAVIIDLASRRKLAGLIIESTFTNAKEMARFVYPFLPPQVFASKFDSLNKIKSINMPKLIIHSINDEIVPYKLGQRLFESAAGPKEFLAIHGGHNTCFFESEGTVKEKISGFIKGLP